MDIYSSRLEKLGQEIKDSQAFFLSDKNDLFYLTGFAQSGLWCLVSRKKFFLLLPPLLFQQAVDYSRTLKSDFKIRPLAAEDLFGLLRKTVKKEKIKTFLFDPEKVNLKTAEKLNKIAKLLPRESLSALRQIKDNYEIDCIRSACRLAVKGFQYAGQIIRPGQSERQVANEIEYYLKKQGGEKISFETIVAAGKNSAYPHHLTSDYIFTKDDLVLLDLGVVYQGYSSDLTRIIFLGKINRSFEKVYSLVKKAQGAAMLEIKPGVPAGEIDRLARQTIEQAGYGKYFVHHTGHGLGLEIHEEPSLKAKNKGILRPGMVFTIEPGIYLPGNFGIRIEDVVLVTEKGHEILTKV